VVAAALPLGIAVGVAVGMLGGGGSVLAVPVLVYLLGQDVAQATTSSLVVVTAGALAGSLGHHREGRVCWRHATAFTAAAVPGVIAGTAAGGVVSPRLLIGTFALIMLAAATATWRKASEQSDDHAARPAGAVCPPLRLGRDIAAGLAIGFLTGFFGVGGGFLVVPTLAIALAFTMRTAVGTSLAIISATSLIALIAHLAAGRSIDAGVTAAMAGGAIVGAVGGSALAGRVPQRTLGRGFAGLVVAVAAYLIVSATVLGGPPGS
jgi:uncharacterized membrane protein YfcA